jgi:hypothetical protein
MAGRSSNTIFNYFGKKTDNPVPNNGKRGERQRNFDDENSLTVLSRPSAKRQRLTPPPPSRSPRKPEIKIRTTQQSSASSSSLSSVPPSSGTPIPLKNGSFKVRSSDDEDSDSDEELPELPIVQINPLTSVPRKWVKPKPRQEYKFSLAQLVRDGQDDDHCVQMVQAIKESAEEDEIRSIADGDGNVLMGGIKSDERENTLKLLNSIVVGDEDMEGEVKAKKVMSALERRGALSGETTWHFFSNALDPNLDRSFPLEDVPEVLKGIMNGGLRTLQR